MEIKKLTVFSATQSNHICDTPLGETLSGGHDSGSVTQLFSLENNTKSLPIVYNEVIKRALDDGSDALVLVHDDVYLESNIHQRLETLFDRFDLVGVAGTSNITLKEPALWHIMGGGFQGGNLHGAVNHGTLDSKHMTGFGPYPHKVILIDGVFMAMNRKVMEMVSFDESNPSPFHFYDLDFSLTCHNNKLRVGVGDIYITHKSPGLREFTDDWKRGQEWFLNKHR